MQITRDAKRAVRLARKVLRGRRATVAVQDLMRRRGPLPQGRFRVGVYFADSDVNIYQMRQWYAPLRLLNETHPVLLISRHAGGALALMQESGLDVALAPKVGDLERLVEEHPLEVILYVNQNTRNFQMMRYGRRWHVFINHGESDKMYMTTNQFKAYDYALVAGDAARARLTRALWDFDVDERTISIGRPQADHLDGEPPYPEDDRTVVLYAPTWEGDRPAAAYGSVVSHGETLVRRLLATGRHRVVYRPHPRSGVVDAEFGEANRRIIAAIAEANRQDPAAHHVFDESPAIDWQLSKPDIAICDVSAMIYDRLATGRPLMVARPRSAAAQVDEGGYLSVCEWLRAEDADGIVEALDRVMGDDEARERLGVWSEHYFGDTTQGAPTRRFHAAIELLLQKAEEHAARDEARQSAAGASEGG